MIQTTDIDDLFPEVFREVPNLPEPTAQVYLSRAVREFCRKTQAWREIETMTVTASKDATDLEFLEPSYSAEVVFIEGAEIDGMPLESVTLGELNNKERGWQYKTDEGMASYITQLQPNTISIYPRQAGVLTATYVLAPKDKSDIVPQFIIDNHAEVIGRGAVWRALLSNNAEYSNPALGAEVKSQWEMDLGKLSSSISRGQQRARHRTIGSYF